MLFRLVVGLVLVTRGAKEVAAARDEGCIAGACKGGFTPESLLLQVERGSGSIVQRALPELPAPYLGQVGNRIISGNRAVRTQLDSPSAKELEHFQLLKDMRTNGFQCASKSFQGIPDTEATFKFDCRLWRAARQWSGEMGSQNFFSHVRGDSNPCKRTSEQGLGACSENIAAGNDSPAATLEQFKKSDGHCVNMMDPGLNRFGAGYVMTSGSEWTHYWTQSMGTDGQPPDQSCLQEAGAPAPSPPAPSPVPSAACVDEDPSCASSYKPYCSASRIQKVCQKTCGVCQSSGPAPVQGPAAEPETGPAPGPAPSPVPTAACVDEDPSCASSYKPFCSASRIQKVCQKTCGVCQSSGPAPDQGPAAQPETGPAPSPVPTAACVDEDPSCASSYKPYCSAPHIQKVCQKTCGVCQSSGPAPDQGPEAKPETGPAPGPAPSPVPIVACKDDDPNCASSYQPYCSASRIQKLCRKTCGMC